MSLTLDPKEFNHSIRGASTRFAIPVIILLVCFLAQPPGAFGQCTAPSLAPAINFPAGDGPEGMAVGDFNGDGKLDLAVPNYNADKVSILLGNGAGNFTLGGSFPVGHQPTYAAAGDFNGDGKLDLAVVNYASFVGGDISILIGNGAGGFAAPISNRVIAYNSSVTVSDLNNDDKLDIVASTYSQQLGNVKVLLGDGTGNFDATADFGGIGDGYSAVVADFNGDGKKDVAIAINAEVGGFFGTGTKLQVLLRDGNGHFGAPTNFDVGTGPTSIALGDFNGDGKPDLAVANAESDNVSVLLGNGVGGFGPATNFAVQDFPNSVVVGDLNGDGKPDLAVSNARSRTVSVLLGDGTGGFSTPTNFAVGTAPVSVVVGDFNGDGKSDLAVANFGSDDVSILINTCGSAAPNSVVSVSAASYTAAVASESIVAAFCSGMASTNDVFFAATNPLPTTLGGTTLKVKDSQGTERLAGLFFASASQVNYQMPPGTANGQATVTVTAGNGNTMVGAVTVESMAPGLFSAASNGSGPPAAYYLRVSSGLQSSQPAAQFDGLQWVPTAISLGPEDDSVFLVLFGTGIRFNAGLGTLSATIDGVPVSQITYAGLVDGFVGLDQVNLLLPRDLIGHGVSNVVLKVDGKVANTVTIGPFQP